MKLIPKDALVAMVEERMQLIRPKNDSKVRVADVPTHIEQGWLNALTWVKDSINAFEMKEVDLEKSISDWLSEGLPNDEELIDYIKETANHFFELGLKAQKGK